jgi:hypothetical protein
MRGVRVVLLGGHEGVIFLVPSGVILVRIGRGGASFSACGGGVEQGGKP